MASGGVTGEEVDLVVEHRPWYYCSTGCGLEGVFLNNGGMMVRVGSYDVAYES